MGNLAPQLHSFDVVTVRPRTPADVVTAGVRDPATDVAEPNIPDDGRLKDFEPSIGEGTVSQGPAAASDIIGRAEIGKVSEGGSEKVESGALDGGAALANAEEGGMAITVRGGVDTILLAGPLNVACRFSAFPDSPLDLLLWHF